MVAPGTGICIEAPPGCGNSFFVNGFQLANPEVQVASHHHVPAQVVNALRLGIPTATILRNPIDSTLSRVAFGRKEDVRFIGANLMYWIRFWETIEDLVDVVPMVSFDSLVTNPSGVVAVVNGYYGTSFVETFPDQKKIFGVMDEKRRSRIGREADTGPSPNRPDEAKAEKKAALRGLVENHHLARKGLAIYSRLGHQKWET